MSRGEDVADLREGDVVELRDDRWPGVVVRGPVRYVANNAYPHVGPAVIWPHSVEHIAQSITVVSRAPRLYVNHPRTEPVWGDVVRSADPSDDGDASAWICVLPDNFSSAKWLGVASKGEVIRVSPEYLPARLRLLVDGETGQVVP